MIIQKVYNNLVVRKSMAKVIDISGKEHEIACIACAIQKGEVELPVERVAETKHFVVEQDFEFPIEGFLIIASKRHISSIMDFNSSKAYSPSP